MIGITAKYPDNCCRCRSRIKKGQIIGWDKFNRQVYCQTCFDKTKEEEQWEAESTKRMVQAQEDAYFERHTQNDTYYERMNDYLH